MADADQLEAYNTYTMTPSQGPSSLDPRLCLSPSMSLERQGLLQDEERNEQTTATESSTLASGGATPLPWDVLSVLLLLTAVQPMAFEIIFPFVNQMIVEIGVVDDPEQVGFYSGFIESIFSCMSFIAGGFHYLVDCLVSLTPTGLLF